mgnify:CR=1 FL=1
MREHERAMREMVLGSLLIGLVAGGGLLKLAPLPSVPVLAFDLGTGVIYAGACLLGPRVGGVIGSVGSALGEVLVGNYSLAPLTFFIRGGEGYLVGLLSTGRGGVQDAMAMALGALAMTAGFTLTAAFTGGLRAMPLLLAESSARGLGGILLGTALCFAARLIYPDVLRYRS